MSRRASFLLVVGLVAAGVSSAQSPQAANERFLRRTLDGTPYRLSVPAGNRGRSAYALVLFLHGGAGRGRDNERHLRMGNGMLVEMFVGANPQFPAFVPRAPDELRAPRSVHARDSR